MSLTALTCLKSTTVPPCPAREGQEKSSGQITHTLAFAETIFNPFASLHWAAFALGVFGTIPYPQKPAATLFPCSPETSSTLPGPGQVFPEAERPKGQGQPGQVAPGFLTLNQPCTRAQGPAGAKVLPPPRVPGSLPTRSSKRQRHGWSM